LKFSQCAIFASFNKVIQLLSLKDRPVTQRAVRGIWIRRLITVGIMVAVCVSFVERMPRGLFASGLSPLVSASTAPSNKAVAFDARHQRSKPAEQARRNNDGYVEGLAATLGYQSPELMATGAIGSDHTMAQR
jgi:hypothetical protein